MTGRPRWHLVNDGEEPPAGRFARDLPDGRRAWFDDRDLDDEDTLPLYLLTQPRWLLWRTETKIDRKTGETRTTKVPFSCLTGKKADVTKPTSWTDYAKVEAALARTPGAWDGPGFALGNIEPIGDVVIGMDLDTCLDPDGNLAGWAQAFLTALSSYAETSPSATGIKGIARIRLADLPEARRLLDIPEGDKDQARTRVFGKRSNGQHAPSAQLFLGARYFAITGRWWPTSPTDVTLLTLEQIAELAALFGPKPTATRANGSDHEADDDDTTPDEAALRNKLAEAFMRNPRLNARWEGGTEGLNDTTRSGRDMSVLAMLVTAGFTRGEVRAALELFEHGKAAGEPPRYFEEMWRRTRATPRRKAENDDETQPQSNDGSPPEAPHDGPADDDEGTPPANPKPEAELTGGEDDPAPPKPEPYGPPAKPTPKAEPPPIPDDVLQAEIGRLALLPELEYDRIDKPAKAKELGLDVGILNRAAGRARRAAKAEAKAKAEDAAKAAKAAAHAANAEAAALAKAAKAEARATKARIDAEARTAKAEAKARAKAREAEAKAAEKTRKIAEASARIDAQRRPQPSPDDDDDPLRDWTPPSPDALPEIIVAAGERHVAADAGLAAMAAAKVPFYQRGKDLVRVCLIKLKLSNGKKVSVPAVSIITRPMLMRALSRTATWHAYNKQFDLVRIDPPGDLGDHILGMIGEWPFPPLRGVIATQTMRYDGTLLTKPGYDEATGLVLFNPPPMPTIPEHPTKRDALEALALLRDLLAEVDFAEDNNVSLSGAISMLMTPVLRGMMPVVPMHVITKPAAGTGGSYMQDITAAIALGERCPVLSLTLKNDEENEKRLSSAALTGQPIIAIDNFTGTLMGDFLCQLIERPKPQVRLLGKSELVTIVSNHCVVANGNNVTIGADTVRRTVQISLDADMENPESRTFSRDPVAEVLADRGKYIAAILTIARAYRVAGTPGRLPPRPSFEDWSNTVRSALVWLGWPDPDKSIKTVRAADPIRSQLLAVVDAWAAELNVGVGYFTSELVTLAGEYVSGSNDRVRPALWEALFAVAGAKVGQLDAARLGLWLQANLNRVIAGHKLLVDRETNKARPRWSVVPR